MCTNYVPTRADRLAALWGVAPHRDDYVTEAYPGYLAPILRRSAGPSGPALRADLAVFGLIPPWSRDGKNFRSCYNARTETVADKPSFKHAWRHRQRCIVAADAFFEPNYETGKAVRWKIERVDGAPMAIAGIWEHWRPPHGDAVTSFSMLTINADDHPVMRHFHAPGDEKRTVVLLAPEQMDAWLDGNEDEARALLAPFPAEQVRTASAPRPPRASAATTAHKAGGTS